MATISRREPAAELHAVVSSAAEFRQPANMSASTAPQQHWWPAEQLETEDLKIRACSCKLKSLLLVCDGNIAVIRVVTGSRNYWISR